MTKAVTPLQEINPDSIRQNPDNPRLIFQEEEMNELLESIREVGIKVPVSVYSDGHKFTLLDGERRWRCAKKLNLKVVPAIVQPKPTRLENLLMMFNIHNVRVDWDLMPMALKLGEVREMLEKEGKDKGGQYPLLSERRNIVVIADEAHRSQYDFIDGFARHLRTALPNASFIGFTATPLEVGDRSTPAVFGDYIDVYDIQRAVEDGATVRIFYEGRLAKIELKEEERPKIDPEFEEVTEEEDVSTKEKLKSKWARMEAMVGTPKRVGIIAKDLVEHFAKRLEAMDGKGMIVCMSRRICVDLYNAIVKLHPEWNNQDDEKGAIKIVMTGSASDVLDFQTHIRNKPRREFLAKRFKDPSDPLKF